MSSIKMEGFYVLGKKTEKCISLEEAIDKFKKDNCNILGVEFRRKENDMPGAIDLLVSCNGVNKISGDYKAIGLEKDIQPIVDKIKKTI